MSDLDQNALDKAMVEITKAKPEHEESLFRVGLEKYLSESGETPPSTPPSFGPFQIFENIRYKNSPDFQRQFGMKDLKIHYEAAFFPDRKPQGAYQDLPAGTPYPLPNLDQVASVARSSPSISCVDIERYWNNFEKNGDEEIDPRGIDAYEIVCNAYNDGLPKDHTYGLYSTIPLRSYWPVIKDSTSKWMETNSKFSGVAELIDMTFPSIYTFYTDSQEDQQRWLKYAEAQVDEARRVVPDVPCYPFLWPVFHSGNKDFQGKPVPKDYFRLQLDFCKAHADGVVIWTESKMKHIDFDNIPDWWDAVVEFIEEF